MSALLGPFWFWSARPIVLCTLQRTGDSSDPSGRPTISNHIAYMRYMVTLLHHFAFIKYMSALSCDCIHKYRVTQLHHFAFMRYLATLSHHFASTKKLTRYMHYCITLHSWGSGQYYQLTCIHEVHCNIATSLCIHEVHGNTSTSLCIHEVHSNTITSLFFSYANIRKPLLNKCWFFCVFQKQTCKISSNITSWIIHGLW